MNRDTSKFLPIGTVVLLRGATKRLMISGYCASDQESKQKVYDYCGCLYPEGIISSNQLALFDHGQIEKIYFFGFSDEEAKKFKTVLIESVSGNK